MPARTNEFFKHRVYTFFFPINQSAMKYFLLVLFSFCLSQSHAQIFRKLGSKVKRDAEWRVQSKADQTINKGLDSLIASPKKSSDNKSSTKSNETKVAPAEPSKPGPNVSSNVNATPTQDDDMEPKDGFITIQLSTTNLFAGGTLLINGESVKYKSLSQVEVSVTGPSTKDIKSVPLTADGKFNTGWYATDQAGEYTVTAKSSDKKSVQSVKFTVYKLIDPGNWCNENIALTNKAFDKLKSETDRAASSLSTKDKADLDKKVDIIKENVAAAVKLFEDLNTAGKEIARLAKSGKNRSANLAGNLSELNNTLEEERKKIHVQVGENEKS